MHLLKRGCPSYASGDRCSETVPSANQRHTVRISPDPPAGPATKNGFGPVLQTNTSLLVCGGIAQPIQFGNFAVAEFRNQFSDGASTGIRVRGSRETQTAFDAAHVDLANSDMQENNDFIMARKIDLIAL